MLAWGWCIRFTVRIAGPRSKYTDTYCGLANDKATSRCDKQAAEAVDQIMHMSDMAAVLRTHPDWQAPESVREDIRLVLDTHTAMNIPIPQAITLTASDAYPLAAVVYTGMSFDLRGTLNLPGVQSQASSCHHWAAPVTPYMH